MYFTIITLFPELFQGFISSGVIARALRAKLLHVDFVDPRDFLDANEVVDDRPYGGGPGMLLKAEPLAAAILASKGKFGYNSEVIYLSAQGECFNQAQACSLAREAKHIILLAGRYEGIDQRVIDKYVDREISVGDYVLSGGEVPAMVLVDAIGRLCPGVLGSNESSLQDSFMEGLLDCPHYTRPQTVLGVDVPAELLTGDHAKIRQWRLKQQLGMTWLKRRDLLHHKQLSANEQQLLGEFIEDYNAGERR